jgi:hypothetical protein
MATWWVVSGEAEAPSSNSKSADFPAASAYTDIFFLVKGFTHCHRNFDVPSHAKPTTK